LLKGWKQDPEDERYPICPRRGVADCGKLTTLTPGRCNIAIFRLLKRVDPKQNGRNKIEESGWRPPIERRLLQGIWRCFVNDADKACDGLLGLVFCKRDSILSSAYFPGNVIHAGKLSS
jgi:hypothetical protein